MREYRCFGVTGLVFATLRYADKALQQFHWQATIMGPVSLTPKRKMSLFPNYVIFIELVACAVFAYRAASLDMFRQIASPRTYLFNGDIRTYL